MEMVLRVVGLPRPQPRPRLGRGEHAFNPPGADAWKARIGLAIRRHVPLKPLSGPVLVDITFVFPRPLSHFKAGEPERGLRPDAPFWHTSPPDRDNLDKAVLDALTRSRLWGDDAQVAQGSIRKRYADPGEAAGAFITIRELGGRSGGVTE
jgi:crossover junction endodeoxyribonuclease RusA